MVTVSWSHLSLHWSKAPVIIALILLGRCPGQAVGSEIVSSITIKAHISHIRSLFSPNIVVTSFVDLTSIFVGSWQYQLLYFHIFSSIDFQTVMERLLRMGDKGVQLPHFQEQPWK